MSSAPIFKYRYIIRSKDRTSGVPNNFTVSLPQIPDNVNDVWIQIQTIYAGAYCAPSDTSTVANFNTNSGVFNQGKFAWCFYYPE